MWSWEQVILRLAKSIATRALHLNDAVVGRGRETASSLSAPALRFVVARIGGESWQLLNLLSVLQVLNVFLIHRGLGNCGRLFK